jgi:squalene-hopene/tetraprenyl-beta-curcumene cyclase
LVTKQNRDGGWGGGPSIRWPDNTLGSSSVEETALATEVMAEFADRADYSRAFQRGVKWLALAVRNGLHKAPSPIGFYFAKLWYYEDLYPPIFAVTALGRAAQQMSRAD